MNTSAFGVEHYSMISKWTPEQERKAARGNARRAKKARKEASKARGENSFYRATNGAVRGATDAATPFIADASDAAKKATDAGENVVHQAADAGKSIETAAKKLPKAGLKAGIGLGAGLGLATIGAKAADRSLANRQNRNKKLVPFRPKAIGS